MNLCSFSTRYLFARLLLDDINPTTLCSLCCALALTRLVLGYFVAGDARFESGIQDASGVGFHAERDWLCNRCRYHAG